jgi:hypothetical protein
MVFGSRGKLFQTMTFSHKWRRLGKTTRCGTVDTGIASKARGNDGMRKLSQALPIQKRQRQGVQDGKTELYNPFEKWQTPDQV